MPAIPASTVVCWQEGRKLQWTDFQAKNRPAVGKTDSLPGTFLAATTEAKATVYDWTTSDGRHVKTFVRVEFDKHESWINKQAYFDRRATLTHEQLHFDVVELTGRKIRQILARCVQQHIDSHVPAITAKITSAYNEEADLQQQLDKETKAGNDLKAQVRWQASIRRQLASLKRYKSTPADCITP